MTEKRLKTGQFLWRMTPEKKEAMEAAAASQGRTLSNLLDWLTDDYLRSIAKTRRPRPKE
jgi:predicted HicB family RNase H-like nuclease